MVSGRFLAAIVSVSAFFAPAAAEEAPGGIFARVLELHNHARDEENLPQLAWSPDLARAAEGWAKTLASEGKLRHSAWKDREGTGENLWIGTQGMFGPDRMIGAFVGEKRHFRPGTFPDVSATGRWQDVAHYTQIIWPSTQQVGCAMAQGKGTDVLVCRYWPAGNHFGGKVG